MRGAFRLRACLLALLAAAASGAACADDALPPAEYNIRQSVTETDTGTRIPRKLYQNSAIPLNRSYAQLTEEEKRIVKSSYETMEPLDEPPFPVDGLKPIFRSIANLQHRLLEEGLLSMQAEVDATGNVTSVGVFSSPDPRLTQAAAAILAQTRFKPAICRGQPCKMSFPLRVTFSVEPRRAF